MDDPDGSDPPPRSRPAESRQQTADAAGFDEIEPAEDPELEVIDVDATDMDQVPDDDPGAL